jgi:protein TonB
MIKSIFILFLFIPTLIVGQETKKIKDKETNETYSVLKSDKVSKHGMYKKYSYNNKLLVKGYYKQGVKDSIWECYDFEGQLTLKYNYNNNEVVFYKPNDKVKDKKYRIINSNSKTDTLLSRPPIFLGGDDLILSYIAMNCRYPTNARENGKSGKVYVAFTVDKNGKTSNFHADNPLGYGMDEEAIRVLKLLPNDWLPGLSNGNPVDVEITYPLIFSLQ